MKAGWKIEPLGELCEFQRGLTYTKRDEVAFSDNVVLRATNIDLTTNLLDFAELKYISDSVVVPESKKVKKGSLMICTASGSKNHLGKVAYIDDDYDYAFGGFMGMITPKSELHSKYLFHLMTSKAYKDFIAQLSDGININNLKFDNLREFQVPYPGHQEQKRIVGILDEALEGVATAKANTEKNLQNARDLFENYLQSVFTKHGEDWIESELGQLAAFRNGINYTADSRGERVKIVGVKDFQQSYWVPQNNLNTVTIDGELKEIDILESGDILTVRSNGNIELIGRCILAGKLPTKITHSGFTIRIRLSTNNLIPEFLCYFMKTSVNRKLLTTGGTGTNIKSLNQRMLSAIKVPYPDISEQKRIVANMNELSAETKRLVSIYQCKLNGLDELKKSLLGQAFSGKL